MVFPPTPTLLIAAGIMLFSVLVMNRAKKAGLINRQWEIALGALAVMLLVIGFGLHLSTPLPAPPAPAAPVPVASTAGAKYRVSFEPKTVRWGEEVRLQVTPEPETITVYLEGKPLVHRAVGKGAFVVTVPSMSKSGYLTVNCAGTRVQATEQLTVLPR